MLTSLFTVAALALQGDALFVSPAWLADHRTDPNLIVLGVGMRASEFREAHVPGARLLNEGVIHLHTNHGSEPPSVERLREEFERVGITDRSQIVLYAEQAEEMWTGIAFVMFDYIGLGDRTRILDGGFAGWKAADLPLESGQVTIERGRFTPRPHPEILVDAGWIEERLGDKNVVFLDARSRGEYDGTRKVTGLLDGHLPGARHLEWTEAFQDDGGWKSVPGLVAMFREAGATGSKEVVTYCQVGMRASSLYLAARRAGLRPKIYLGSMADWSSVEDRPMRKGSQP